MHPTPIVGNWGDLPCAWDEGRLQNADTSGDHDSPTLRDSTPRAECLKEDGKAQTDNSTLPAESPAEVVPPSRFDASPTALVPIDAGVLPIANTVLPIASTMPFPHVITPTPSVAGRVGGGGLRRPTAGGGSESGNCFLPPAPPSRSVLSVLLASGCPFNTFYSILMTWYDRVVFMLSTTAALQLLPKCPPVSHYVHDFDGWLIQLELWYSRVIQPQTAKAIKATAVAQAPPPTMYAPPSIYAPNGFAGTWGGGGAPPPPPPPMAEWAVARYMADPNPYFGVPTSMLY